MTWTTETTGREATKRHGRRLVAVTFAVALLVVSTADARLGDLDSSFGSGGIAAPNVGATLEDVTTRSDGRPVAAGTGADEAVVVQLTATGAPDTTFGAAGVTRFPNGAEVLRLHGIALDNQGRVLAAGDRRSSTLPAGQTMPVVQRLTDSGGSGSTFVVGGNIGEARAVAPLADGKILVAGHRATDTAAVDQFFVARLNETGTLDGSFGGGDGIADIPFGTDAEARAMAVDANGRIVLAGIAGGQPAIARVDANGAPDQGFDADGRLMLAGTGELRAVQVDGSQRIVAAGFSGSSALVTRRLTSGAPDAGFGAGGVVLQDGAVLNGLALDGARSLVAGTTGGRAPQILLGSLNGAGTPEAALGWRAFAGAPAASGLALGPGGAIYTAGGPQPYISRHLPNAPPIPALASPARVFVGEGATFDAVGSSDPEGEQLRYSFDLDGNGSFEFDGGTNPLALRSFPAPGSYTVGVRVTDPRGASAATTRSVTVRAGSVPRPVLGKQGVAKPLSGIVRYRLPGKRRFKRLTKLTAIPNGTVIDARKGKLLLTVLHDASGRLDGARFYAGRFIFRQGKGKRPITTLKLTGGSFKNCTARNVAEGEPRGTSGLAWQAKPQSSTLATAASIKDGPGTRSKRRVRKLWGDGRGRFRTRGRYGAATVRGTKWLTLDRCDGTKVRVVRGKVSVKDLDRPKRTPKLVKAGGKAFVPYKAGKSG